MVQIRVQNSSQKFLYLSCFAALGMATIVFSLMIICIRTTATRVAVWQFRHNRRQSGIRTLLFGLYRNQKAGIMQYRSLFRRSILRAPRIGISEAELKRKICDGTVGCEKYSVGPCTGLLEQVVSQVLCKISVLKNIINILARARTNRILLAPYCNENDRS